MLDVIEFLSIQVSRINFRCSSTPQRQTIFWRSLKASSGFIGQIAFGGHACFSNGNQHTCACFSMASADNFSVSFFPLSFNFTALSVSWRDARPAALPCAGCSLLLDRGFCEPPRATVSCRLSRIALHDRCGHRCRDASGAPNFQTDAVVSARFFVFLVEPVYVVTHSVEAQL